jgi:hypothetical protein
MERSKIKFKYLMNLWKTLPSYPTHEDIVYELSVYLAKDGRPNGEFTMQTFNSAFGSDWSKTKHGEVIQEMIESGVFEKTSENQNNKTKYKIKETPEYLRSK